MLISFYFDLFFQYFSDCLQRAEMRMIRWMCNVKDDMQRFFTKLMQKSFLAAYCSINPYV